MEDVPMGKIYGITAGYQIQKQSGRLYLGGTGFFWELL